MSRSFATLSSLLVMTMAQLAGAGSAQGAPPVLPKGAEKIVEESWEGKLNVGPQATLRLVLRLSRPGGADHPVSKAVIDSPDQGAFGIEVQNLTFEGGTLAFLVPSIRGGYHGQLDATGASASGEWSQGGARLPLTLQRTSAPVHAPRRPQEPKAPLPYRTEEVGYDNPAARVHLAATLSLPAKAGQVPAVVLVTGSGAEDRDEAVFGHKPFLVLADALTRRGVVVLRADDRGVGGSTGDTPSSTSEELAGDALAGVAFLKARPEVDKKRIGLVGHSEGSIIAALAANRSADVAFVVLLSGPALPGDEIIVLQAEAISRAAGKSDEVILQQQAATERRLLAVVKSEKDDTAALNKLREILKDALAQTGAPTGPQTDAAVEGQLAALTSRWFRYFVSHDPRTELVKLRCPVLALQGEKDLQVPARENLPALRAALAANKAATVKLLPGLNHLLQTARTGSPTEYGTIEETLSPTALKAIGDFVLGIGPGRPGPSGRNR